MQAELEYGFVAADAQPTGAKMDHPDHGARLELDAKGLTMRQENPQDAGRAFLESAVGIAALANKLIQPHQIYYSGFAAKYVMPFPSEQDVFAATLKFGLPYYNELADGLGMTPSMQELTYDFTSGSYDLQVTLKPVAFNAVRSDVRRSYGFRSTENHRRNIDRWNAYEDARTSPQGYALMLEADLRENNPPEGALNQQFEALEKYIELLGSHFNLDT